MTENKIKKRRFFSKFGNTLLHVFGDLEKKIKKTKKGKGHNVMKELNHKIENSEPRFREQKESFYLT